MMRIRNDKNFPNFFSKNTNVTTELPSSLAVHVDGMGWYYPSLNGAPITNSGCWWAKLLAATAVFKKSNNS